VSRFKGCAEEEKPFLSKWHRGVQLEFAVTHQSTTVEDWELVEILYETNVNHLGSISRK